MTKTLLTSIITLIISCSAYSGFAQDSLFKKQYAPVNYRISSSIGSIVTHDGNFVVGTTCKENIVTGDTWYNPVLLKLSPKGDVLWSFSYQNESEHFYFSEVAELSNGELIVVGIYIGSTADAYQYIMKISADGSRIVWQNRITNLAVANPTKLIIGDNDEIWLANTANISGKLYDVILTKYRTDGTYEWMNHYGRNGEDIIHDMIINNRGNLVIATEVDDAGSLGRDIELTEINTMNGDLINSKYLILENHFMRNIDIINTTDNNYYLCFTANPVNFGGGTPPEFIFAVKTDDKFNLLWHTMALETGMQYSSYSIHQLQNGRVVLYGSYFIGSGAGAGQGNIIIPLTEGDFDEGYLQLEPLVDQTSSNGSIMPADNGLNYYTGLKTHHHSPNNSSFITFRNFSPSFEFCKLPDRIITKQDIGDVYSADTPPYIPENIGNVTRGSLNLAVKPITFTNATECSIFDFNCASELNLQDTTICGADEFTLNSGVTGYSYKWSTGDTTASIKVNTSGKYYLMAYAPPIFGCDTLYDSATITLTEPIDAELIGPINAKAYDRVTFSAQGSNTYNYAWDLGDGTKNTGQSIQHTYTQTGNYRVLLTVTDTNNCIYEDSLLFNSYGFTYYIPNAFSPNNDGVNDVFAPKGVGIANYKLSVFNRWGELLYEGENEGWAGTYQNTRVISGEYIFTLSLQSDTYQKVNISGKVFVIY